MNYVLDLMLSYFSVEYSLITFSVDSSCIRCLSSEYANILRTIFVLIIRELTTLDIFVLIMICLPFRVGDKMRFGGWSSVPALVRPTLTFTNMYEATVSVWLCLLVKF